MKNVISLFLLGFSLCLNAQYGAINSILDVLEARRSINQNIKDVNLEDKKFILVKDFEDHTEREFIIFGDKALTFVEVFDDKKTGESSSNVFSGDMVRTKHNIVSMRADKLEGEKIAFPVTKTFLITMQRKIVYLIDLNTKERWVEDSALSKYNPNKK